jgi:HPt (histidine-containing phosphotransfer) domain-containing protein
LSEMSEAITRLSERFLARATDDLRDLKLWAADPTRHNDELRRLTHRLAGGAGTFGFRQLSALAGEAEDAILCGAPDLPARLARVMKELRRLTQELGG